MAEWLKAAVLKTVSGVTRSGVRIPLPPPFSNELRSTNWIGGGRGKRDLLTFCKRRF
jgi:hypothetical protein